VGVEHELQLLAEEFDLLLLDLEPLEEHAQLVERGRIEDDRAVQALELLELELDLLVELPLLLLELPHALLLRLQHELLLYLSDLLDVLVLRGEELLDLVDHHAGLGLVLRDGGERDMGGGGAGLLSGLGGDGGLLVVLVLLTLLLEVGRIDGAGDGVFIFNLDGGGHGAMRCLGQHEAPRIGGAEHSIVIIIQVVLAGVEGWLPVGLLIVKII
jgi:hypothetical protein